MRSILLGFILLVAAMAPAAGEPKGIVSITFDDASASQYTNGLRIAKKYGLRGTLFVGTKGVSDAGLPGGEWAMNWDNVRAFHDAGWEIGSHSHSHLDLITLSDTDLSFEARHSRELIRQNVGVDPVSFASPYGQFNATTVASVMKEYQYHLKAWGGNEGRNDPSDILRNDIGRMDVGVGATSASICGEMLQAGINGQWLVLIFHRIVETTPLEYEISVDSFDEMMQCAQQLADRNMIRVLPVNEAVARSKN